MARKRLEPGKTPFAEVLGTLWCEKRYGGKELDACLAGVETGVDISRKLERGKGRKKKRKR